MELELGDPCEWFRIKVGEFEVSSHWQHVMPAGCIGHSLSPDCHCAPSIHGGVVVHRIAES